MTKEQAIELLMLLSARRHLQTLAACNAIESETICSPAYDVTWYWITE
jgi:hypothetical protein